MRRFLRNTLKACALILLALALVHLFLFFFPNSFISLPPLKSGLIFLALGTLSAFLFRAAKALRAPKKPSAPPLPKEQKTDDNPQ